MLKEARGHIKKVNKEKRGGRRPSQDYQKNSLPHPKPQLTLKPDKKSQPPGTATLEGQTAIRVSTHL